MSDALVTACSGDWDRAWDLLPEEDYLEKQVHHYDPETHLIVHGAVHQGRRIAGTLLFIRLQKQASLRERKTEPAPPPPPSAKGKRAFSKQEVEVLVAAYDLVPLVDAARADKRILRDLMRLLYSADPLLRWKAAEALGRVSAVVARFDPGAVKRILQGLFSSLTDTAASSWGAIEAIGEILACSPESFSEFVPQLGRLSGTPTFLEEVLRALGRIAETRADLLQGLSSRMLPLLTHPAPAVRGPAAVLLGNLRAAEARGVLEELRVDPAEIDVYRHGVMEKKTVGQLAVKALSRI
jgi:HEAT repeat protein